MLNKSKYLILALIVIALFLPRPASAILGTGIFDLFDHMLHGISEQTSPMIVLMVGMLFLYLVLLVLFWVSGFVLEAFITEQANWMADLQGMTEVGWNFTAGIANMLLIIIFLVIAFAFIFKIESLQAKKSLPRLIIVAVLLNFSLLFVNALVDISQVGYNTILEAMPDGLIARVTSILIMPLLFTIVALVSLVAGLIIAWSIPIASAFAQILFAALFIPFVLPFLVLIGIQMLLFAPLALMFVAYVFLFGARVFVIQILAMLAPLAFICLILPQTKKYWDEWFQHLVQWLLLGIVVLFLLALGFTALDALHFAPGSILACAGVPGPLLPICAFIEGVVFLAIFYFGVFVYLMVILFISKKFMPTFASFIIDQGKAMAGNIFQMGLKPFGAAAAYHWKRGVSESKWIQKRAEREAVLQTPELKGGRKLLAPFVIPGYMIRRNLGKALGPGLRESRNRELIAAERKLMDIETPALFEAEHRSQRSHENRIPSFAAAIEKGGPFKEALEKDFSQAKEAAKKAHQIGMVPQAEKIARGFKEKFTEKDLQEIGFKPHQELSGRDKEEWNAKGYKTITDKLMGDAKGSEIKHFSKNFWTSPEAMEAVQRFWGGPQLAMAADTFGRRFVDDYMQVANKLTADQMARFNPKAALYLTGNAAQDFGFRAPKSREEMREKVRGRPPGYMPSEEELGELRKAIKEAFPEKIVVTPPPSHRPDELGDRGPHGASL